MKAQLAALIELVVMTAPTGAVAEPFSGVWRTDPGMAILSIPDTTLGKGSMAMHYHGSVTLTSSKGAFTFSAECIAWQTPSEATPIAAICQLRGQNEDGISYRLACDPPSPETKSVVCWGSLRGTGGRFARRIGAFSVVSDPKDGSATGQGAWTD